MLPERKVLRQPSELRNHGIRIYIMQPWYTDVNGRPGAEGILFH